MGNLPAPFRFRRRDSHRCGKFDILGERRVAEVAPLGVVTVDGTTLLARLLHQSVFALRTVPLEGQKAS